MPKPSAPMPVSRFAGWKGHHHQYRKAAHRNMAASVKVLEAAAKKYRSMSEEPLTDQLPEYIELLDEYRSLLTSAQIYAAMAIEAFLNFYGVIRLGHEEYYRRYKGTPVRDKLAGLLAECEGVTDAEEEKLTALVLPIFKRRNDLVHPKAAEINLDAPAPGIEAKEWANGAKDSVASMEQFFARISTLSSDSRKAVEFFKWAWE